MEIKGEVNREKKIRKKKVGRKLRLIEEK